MEIVKKEISLNVGQPNNFEMICAMQGDNKSFEVTATLYDVNKLYKITTNTIRIKGLNALGENIYLNVDSHTDYTVTFILTEQILTYDGLVRLVLVFNDGGKQLTTFPFVIKVINSPGNTDTSDAKAISALVEEAEKWANLSKSYAVGTNDTIRNGDSTDNSKYYCEQSKLASQNAKNASDKSEKASKDSQDTYDKIKKIADEIKNITPSSLKKYKEIIVGDGIKSVFNLNHQLNTKDIIFEMNDGEETVLIDYLVVDENNTKITFEIPPTVNDMYYVTIFGVDDVGTNSGGSSDIIVNGVKIVPFETGSDDEIEAMLLGHYDGKINIADYWNIGDKRSIHINEIQTETNSSYKYHHEDDYIFRIIGLNQSDLTNIIIDSNSNRISKAAVTVQMEKILTTKNAIISKDDAELEEWAMGIGTNSVYGASGICGFLNNKLRYALPNYIQNNLKNVRCYYGGWSSSIPDGNDNEFVFLLSEYEITGQNNNGYSVNSNEFQYDYFKNNTNNIFKLPPYISSDKSAQYLTRTTAKNDISSQIYIDENGIAKVANQNTKLGIAPAFCL